MQDNQDPVYFVEQEQNINPEQNSLDKFKKFIREWQVGDQGHIYRQQLMDNTQIYKYLLEVELEDLCAFDWQLEDALKTRPLEMLPIFEEAAKQVYLNINGLTSFDDQSLNFQILISSKNKRPIPLRQLKSNILGQLVTVQGIIISCSKSQIKASKVFIECKGCQHTKTQESGFTLGGAGLPRFCGSEQNRDEKKCPSDPYVIIPEKCVKIDQQILKIQENPECIPTGEIPRTFQIVVDRTLVNKLSPGQRILLTGVYQILENKSATANQTASTSLKVPYIHVIGYSLENAMKQIQTQFTQEDIEQFKSMAKEPKIFERISKNIAPAIYGQDDIKKSLACLLFGGTRKQLADKMKLRGDINVLLIGDPSTGKSQFLKAVERIAPVSIYTSGKGSSAAGLTASINRDMNTGEFNIEAGAMVLADGGVICIDEFDKMRAEDRVAIHEAMEQQTISIAKAGITTRLNSRCSVLAAANPIFGSYNDSKNLEDQMELQTTILSRFDCIFVVRDLKVAENDLRLAQHILNLHSDNMDLEEDAKNKGDMDFDILKKYIAYARSEIHPKLTEKSAKAIANLYVEDRQQSNQANIKSSTRSHHIPITVRQLEAIVRLSESIAKIHLCKDVEEKHIHEAHKIFTMSTLNAIRSGKDVGIQSSVEMGQTIQKIEEYIKKKIQYNSSANYSHLRDQVEGIYPNAAAVDKAVMNLINMGVLQFQEGKRKVFRKKI